MKKRILLGVGIVLLVAGIVLGIFGIRNYLLEKNAGKDYEDLRVEFDVNPAVDIPYAAENHQYYNAMELVKNDAAILIEEKDFTGERLIKEIDALLSDRKRLEELGANAKKMAIYDATERIVSCICEIVR